MKQNTPTPEELRTLFNYDPETGSLTWKVRASRCTCIGDPAGTIDKDGYCSVKIRGKGYFAHRIIWAIQTGEWPTQKIDHKDTLGPKFGFGNRWENLRQANNVQNGQNRRIHRNNKSGIPGVFWITRDQCWRVTLRKDYKVKYLGSYRDLNKAKIRRHIAEEEYFADFRPQLEG